MATSKQPAMEWADEHDILLLREMTASELFQFKKGSPDCGKIWESIHERLNTLDNPKFMIKEKRGIRDWWNLLQTNFKCTQREELWASGIDCELSEKDALIEELGEKEGSWRNQKEGHGVHGLEKKSSESAGGSAKKGRRSGGDAFEFVKEKA